VLCFIGAGAKEGLEGEQEPGVSDARRRLVACGNGTLSMACNKEAGEAAMWASPAATIPPTNCLNIFKPI
jgi:hypothetical protein